MTADTRVGTGLAISPEDWCALDERRKRDWLLQHGAGAALKDFGIDSPYTVRNEYATGKSVYPVLTMVQSPNAKGYDTALCGSIPSFMRGGAEQKGYAALRAVSSVSLVSNTSFGTFNLRVEGQCNEPTTVFYDDFNGNLQADTHISGVHNGIYFTSESAHLFTVVTTVSGTCIVLKTLNPRLSYLRRIKDDASIRSQPNSSQSETVMDYRNRMSEHGLFVPSADDIVNMLQEYDMVKKG